MKHVPRIGLPWWKEPWPWILMAGPALAMAGCFVTIFLAVRHDDPVVEHRKRGLVIERPAASGAAPAGAAMNAKPVVRP